MGASYGEWQPWKLRMVSGMSCGSGGWYGSHGNRIIFDQSLLDVDKVFESLAFKS